MKPFMILPVLITVLLVAAACGGNSSEAPPTSSPPASTATSNAAEPTQSPAATAVAATPSATPAPATPAATPGVITCPLAADVCNTADEIATALEARDFEAIVALVQAREEECPGGEPQGAGGPFPLCDGAPAGEKRSGYMFGRRYSGGGIMNADGLVRMIEGFLDDADTTASDAYGDGATKLVAVTCAEGTAAACTRATIVFSALFDVGPQENREVLVFWMDLPVANAAQPLDSVWNGLVLPEEAPVLMQTGGPMQGLGEVYVLDR